MPAGTQKMLFFKKSGRKRIYIYTFEEGGAKRIYIYVSVTSGRRAGNVTIYVWHGRLPGVGANASKNGRNIVSKYKRLKTIFDKSDETLLYKGILIKKRVMRKPYNFHCLRLLRASSKKPLFLHVFRIALYKLTGGPETYI